MYTKILGIYDSLSKSDKEIADFFLNHSKEIVTMNISEMAEKIGTSSASISRFVRKVLGKSFSETKIEIAKNYENLSKENAIEIFNWGDDFEKMPDKIILNINSVCKDVMTFNDIKTINKAVDMIAAAENVFLFGIGNSGIVAQDMAQKLLKLKKRPIYSIDSNFGVLNSTICSSNDVVMAISFSGRTREVNRAVKKAKEMGAKIITITSNTKNTLRGLGDISIVIPSVEFNESRLAPIFSRYGQFFVIDMIFVGLAKRLSTSPSEFINSYTELLMELKDNK